MDRASTVAIEPAAIAAWKIIHAHEHLFSLINRRFWQGADQHGAIIVTNK